MSQIIKNLASGPVPPPVATSYVTDVNSPAIPAANILDVFGGQTTTNNDKGVQTDGSSGSNILTVQLTNRTTSTVTTADATLTTIITFPLGATPATFYFNGNVQAFNSSTPAGASYGYSGAVRTDGASATLISAAYHDEFEEPALATADIFLAVSGNNALLQVQGVAATSINWNSLLEYRMVG